MAAGDNSQSKQKLEAVKQEEKLQLIDADGLTKRQFLIAVASFSVALLTTAIVSYFKVKSQILDVEQRLVAKFEVDLAMTRMSINNNASENIIFLKVFVLNPNTKIELARQIAKSIYKWARVYERDPDLMLALIEIESNFDPTVTSNMGAQGLTQIMPFWYEIFKEPPGKFYEVDSSIRYSHQILALYEKQYGTLEMALIAYNRGNHQIESDLLRGKDPRNGYAEKIVKVFNRLKSMNVGG